MPPIPIRQSPSIPGVPRPSTDSAKEPIPGTKYISLRVMLELLAGTLAIFIIGVLVWKLGRFIRSFTRKRVLQGNAPTTRYARTWYGWVPLQRHEHNRELVQTRLQRLCGWTTWSSKADYRWVWWDPGSKEFQRHNEKRKLRRWLPGFLRSRSFTTADDIWNPVLCRPASHSGTYVYSAGMLEGLVLSSDVFSREAVTRSAAKGRDVTVDEFRDSEIEVRGHLRRNIRRMWDGTFAKSRYSADDARFWHWRTAWTSQLDYIAKKNKQGFTATNYYLNIKKSRSLPCLLSANVFQQQHEQRSKPSMCAGPSARRSISLTPLQILRYSRKYQVWSARMQLKKPYCVKNGSLGPLAPPGSPISDILASISSHQASLLDLAKLDTKRSSISSDMIISRDALRQRRTDSLVLSVPVMGKDVGERCPASGFRQAASVQSSSGGASPHSRQSQLCVDESYWTSSKLVECALTDGHKRCDKKPTGSSIKDMSEIKIPIRILSDWEIRSMYALSCRLEWLANQLSPGRRPFHFAMLPNHWMNKRTWIVYDPPCRVSIDARRRLGDTRFFTSYPMPDWTPKPKYPQVHRKLAHRPRIDSWRNAVNHRRSSLGLAALVKTIELYESSGEDPPDGKVDPASWMLRRPPQGVGPPKNQENVYYEGGSGWQETFRDWQRVRRGYRVRKMVHQGRINRTRVKEFALGISRSRTAKYAVNRQPRGMPGCPIQRLSYR